MKTYAPLCLLISSHDACERITLNLGGCALLGGYVNRYIDFLLFHTIVVAEQRLFLEVAERKFTVECDVTNTMRDIASSSSRKVKYFEVNFF